MNVMLDFSFLRTEHSVKLHVCFFQVDSKVISFEIKRGKKAHITLTVKSQILLFTCTTLLRMSQVTSPYCRFKILRVNEF